QASVDVTRVDVEGEGTTMLVEPEPLGASVGPAGPDVGPAFGAGAVEEDERGCGVGREMHGRSEKPGRPPARGATGGLLATGAPGRGGEPELPLGDDPLEDGRQRPSLLCTLHDLAAGCQAPAGKTASTMTIWKVRITDWPVASNVASTSTE